MWKSANIQRSFIISCLSRKTWIKIFLRRPPILLTSTMKPLILAGCLYISKHSTGIDRNSIIFLYIISRFFQQCNSSDDFFAFSPLYIIYSKKLPFFGVFFPRFAYSKPAKTNLTTSIYLQKVYIFGCFCWQNHLCSLDLFTFFEVS